MGLAVGAGLLLAIPALVRAIRRRRSLAGDSAALVAMYWRRALDATGEIGVKRTASCTPVEQASITAVQFPVVARPMRSLAEAITKAAYAPAGTESARRSDCAQWCHQIESAVNESISPAARVRRYFTRFD